MKRAFKYRIYPNSEQEMLIRKTVGCARFVYNGLLEDYKSQLESKTEKPKVREVTFLKETHPFLNEVDSLALANAKQHLLQALKNFFDSRNGKRMGKKVRFPKRHKKGKSKLSYTTNNQQNSIRIESGRIKLPKLGFVKVKEHTPLCGAIRSVTVVQERNDTYYVSILTECDRREAAHKTFDLGRLKVVGLDMSYGSFVVSSDKEKDDAKPKYIRQYRSNERKRARLNRRFSKCEKGSHNREKARRRLANLDRHIANSRRDFCHKASRFYVDNYDVIVLEDIDMQAQQRGLGNGKSVGDLGFGMFKQYLSYKGLETDTAIVYVDRWFASSKLCNHCGNKNAGLRLSDRAWVCPCCGTLIDRDYNAACNLRDYFYKIINNTVGTTGIHACGDASSTLRETLMQVASSNQEAPSFRWG